MRVFFLLVINSVRILKFLWATIRPIYKDLMFIISEVNSKDLDNYTARQIVFQDITDVIQKRGLERVPDSVLNCSIELCYQIYKWDSQTKKGNEK